MKKIISIRSPSGLTWWTFEKRPMAVHVRQYERDDTSREDWNCVKATNIKNLEAKIIVEKLKEKRWKIQ